jgi:two-component system, LytTR family, response regulator
MIQCVVIDDSEEAIKLLKRHIGAKPNLALVKTFINPTEALHYLEREFVDLVFVDIQMPVMSGLELIEILQAKKDVKLPHFILTTGHSEYALESYNYEIMDYILKPVTFKRFSLAVDKYVNKTKLLKTEIPAKDNFFFAEIEGVKTRINSADIVYIEGAGNYISIFTITNRILLHKTMSSFVDLLDNKQFIRIHKSILVSVHYIKGIRGSDLFLDYQDKQVKVPIGITYKKALAERLLFI